MANADATSYDDEFDFPVQFLRHADTLLSSDGEVWAKFMYGDWYVCPTSQLAKVFRIEISRRGEHSLPRMNPADGQTIDVVADTTAMCESSSEYGFQLPHVSLRDLLLSSVEWLEDENGAIADIDKPDAAKLIDDIESTCMAAIKELRSKIE